MKKIDPTKTPPGTKNRWVQFPFNPAKAIPFMTAGIILIIILELIISFTRR